MSFRHRDELASATANAGWQTIAARRADNAEQRFVASGAMIAVVDARGSFGDGLAAVRSLADAVEVNAAALLVLVSRTDIGSLDLLIEAGATHYLASPFKEAEFVQSLRFAERHAVRLAGGWRAVEQRRGLDQGEALSWQADVSSGKALISEALRARLGLTSTDIEASSLIGLLAAADRPVARAAMRRLRRSGKATAFTHDLRGVDNDDARVAHHLRIETGTNLLFGTIEILASEADIRGGRDPLTGLRDAASARRWIDVRMARRNASFYVMLISITRFEMINTAFGRDTGDQLLQIVARLIGPLVAESGGKRSMIARTAGAEFIIGLDGAIGEDRALILAEHLAEQIEKPLLSGSHLVSLSSRISIVENDPGDGDATHILRRASAALADAKATDQGRIRVINHAEQSAAARDHSLQADLRKALDNDEIEMLFQPQVSVPTGRIIGVEALARWKHPIHGELGAATLFAVAEQSDYLLALSQHIQHRAASQAALWPSALSGLRLAVNITASDIGRAGFAENFLAMIDASGFPRGKLTVEVTESGLIEDLNAAAALLAALRAGGCRVAIDDFGTGYSSLAYLKALPLDYLKIDKKLAQDIAGSTRDRIVVRGVIDMARSLGLAVIAEGVETEEQLSLLAREGCNYYQGFLCAEALSASALELLVSRWPN
ncbi:MAG: putative bifunctional diguanylate cyclase/phosphodiesterase [Sphingomonadaceae bacterium]